MSGGFREALCLIQPGQRLARHPECVGPWPGPLLVPYAELPLDRRARIERIGVPLRQEDLWKEAIRAAGKPRPKVSRSQTSEPIRSSRGAHSITENSTP